MIVLVNKLRAFFEYYYKDAELNKNVIIVFLQVTADGWQRGKLLNSKTINKKRLFRI
jgi:hypothetical protein